MEYEIESRPSYALLSLALDAGESVRTEAGSMVSYDDGIEVETNASGGVLGSLKRTVLGGESFFQNTFTATEAGEVTLAPALSGDVTHYDLDGTLLVQSGSYLASHPDVDLDTKFGGGRTFFGGEGLFLLKLDGTGPVFLSSYGAIRERELAEGETFSVDTGHIVAFDDTASFDVQTVGGLKSTLFSGEGLVCTFTGPGRVWTQTRSPDAFLAWLIPQLPSNGSSN
jgi:uncharacterized protein (TIGR00266 family)